MTLKRKIFTATFLGLLGLSTSALSPMQMAYAADDDPCPAPKKAMSNTPNDLAKIQEDIDRFALCVERAQLLERLNALVANNLETIESTILKKSTDTGMAELIASQTNVRQQGNSRAAVAPSIPPLNAQMAGELDSDVAIMQQAMNQSTYWEIAEISGANGVLTARLKGANNEIEAVKQGDTLSDKSRVFLITPSEVKVRNSRGNEISLNWTRN